MPKLIKTSLVGANLEALDGALKTALTAQVCYGVVVDRNGVFIQLADAATTEQINQALSISNRHDPAALTPAQQEIADGLSNLNDVLNKVDTALSDLTAKRADFVATPTLAKAAPLLLEVSQDLIGVLKAIKYIAKRIP